MGALLHDFDRQNVASLTATERVAVSLFHLVSPGDKRDGIFVYALRIGERPVCHLASVSSGLGPVTGGVVFSSCQNCSIKRTH